MVGEMRRRKRNTLYSPMARIYAVLGRVSRDLRCRLERT